MTLVIQMRTITSLRTSSDSDSTRTGVFQAGAALLCVNAADQAFDVAVDRGMSFYRGAGLLVMELQDRRSHSD